LMGVQGLNLRPIIGVLDQPAPKIFDNWGDTYIPASYIKWLESAGSRVVPIPHKASHQTLTKLFNSINGILFTGGSLSLQKNTPYYQTALFLYNLALQANQKGDFFPIWGTCQGFQILSIITADNETVDERYHFDSENLPLPLQFTSGARTSRMFAKATDHVFDTFQTKNVTMNLHHDGVPPVFFQTNPNLRSFYHLLSTNTDRKGNPFGSSYEGRIFPIYATQFHPERNAFEWDLPEKLDHSEDAVEAMQYLVNFFIQETRKSDHSFSTLQEEYSWLIYNWPPYPTYDSNESYPEQQTYVFIDLANHVL